MMFPTAILLVSIRIFRVVPNVSRIEPRGVQGKCGLFATEK